MLLNLIFPQPNSNSMKFKPYWKRLNKDQKLALAIKLKTSYAYLSHIANSHRLAGAKIIMNIERATDGIVKQRDIRDI